MNNSSLLRVVQRATACVLSSSVLVMISGCPKADDGDEQQDLCAGVSKKQVRLEVDMSPSISALGDWLDINESGKLRKAFANCCTEFVGISAAYDTEVLDCPESYDDCYDEGYDSWDGEYKANMHLILAKKIEGANVFGYTPVCGQASPEGGSWVFVQRIDEFIDDGDSYASRKLFGTREATHELGHHRSAFIEEACEQLSGEWQVSSWHYDENGDPDGDCVMATPYVTWHTTGVYSFCGTGVNLLDKMYFCYKCRETIKDVSW
jgi:hypothetical protein